MKIIIFHIFCSVLLSTISIKSDRKQKTYSFLYGSISNLEIYISLLCMILQTLFKTCAHFEKLVQFKTNVHSILKSRIPNKKNCQYFSLQGAKITKSSHFSQSYKLGYKILLICEAESPTLPTIKWYKDGLELKQSLNMHVSCILYYAVIVENL